MVMHVYTLVLECPHSMHPVEEFGNPAFFFQVIIGNREFSTLQCVLHCGVARGAECHPWQWKICQKEGKIRKNEEKYGRKGKHWEGSWLRLSWQIGLATLLVLKRDSEIRTFSLPVIIGNPDNFHSTWYAPYRGVRNSGFFSSHRPSEIRTICILHIHYL